MYKIELLILQNRPQKALSVDRARSMLFDHREVLRSPVPFVMLKTEEREFFRVLSH